MQFSEESICEIVRLLLTKALDGTIEPDEVRQLDGLLAENASARRYYLEYIHLHQGLRRLTEEKAASILNCDEGILDQRLWDELAQNERLAEPAAVAVPEAPAEKYYDFGAACAASVPWSARVNKLALSTALASSAALFLAVCYLLLLPPVPPIVATLSDAIECRWAEGSKMAAVGQDLRAECYTLASGVIKARFDSGVEVVIEGPAAFEPLSVNKMRLTGGKVFARVPNTAIGFTIDTPESSVVDLGTAFGVFVSPGRESGIHVHDGKVNLIAGSSGQTQTSEIVTRLEARKVDGMGGRIMSAAFERYLFIQEIASNENRISYGPPISVVDLVGGGDGFVPVGSTHEGIDPATGEIHPAVQRDFGREGSGRFVPVPRRRFIDGVFVPNGASVVSSAGHVCDAFPATAGTFWSDITTEPLVHHVSLDEAGEVLYEQYFPATLSDGAVSLRQEVPRLLLHSNAGITVDLEAVRRSFKGSEIVRFRAMCGVSVNAPAKMRQEFWALLDGRAAFRCRLTETSRQPQEIEVMIRPSDRFLTLAVTDGGDGTSFDWGLFEAPRLEMAPKGLD
jgi:hypothetical protein